MEHEFFIALYYAVEIFLTVASLVVNRLATRFGDAPATRSVNPDAL
jgi:hypothetical protein